MAGEKKILIVEDEQTLVQVLTDVLGDEIGCTVLTAADGAEGLALAQKEHPDLTLLDIIMPGMDGLEMLRKLREDEWGKEAQVILLTNVSDNARLAEALEMGAYEYLVKSDHTIDEIARIVKGKLQQSD